MIMQVLWFSRAECRWAQDPVVHARDSSELQSCTALQFLMALGACRMPMVRGAPHLRCGGSAATIFPARQWRSGAQSDGREGDEA